MNNAFITLDFWNTLAIPNPTFAEKRNLILVEHFDSPLSVVKEKYAKIKQWADTTAITDGSAVSCGGMYRKLFSEFASGREYNYVSVPVIIDLKNKIDALFLKYPPTIYANFQLEISKLHSIGYKFGLISNTNFISGTILSELLKEIPFEFTLYSDRMGMAKPNPRLFFEAIMLSNARPADITHIGDNKICDYDGAKRMSMNAVLIKNPLETLSYLETLDYRNNL